jgi:aldehyde dehydrogenase (NAD+)
MGRSSKLAARGRGRIDVTDPATGAPLAEHALADAADVDRAVEAARRCHLSGDLTAMRPIERGRHGAGDGSVLAGAQGRQIARVLTLNRASRFGKADVEVEGAALYFEYYGNQASTVEGRSIPWARGISTGPKTSPFGVSAQIIPWNYPVEMTARSLSARWPRATPA